MGMSPENNSLTFMQKPSILPNQKPRTNSSLFLKTSKTDSKTAKNKGTS